MSQETTAAISEKTRLPLGLAISAVVGASAIVIWGTQLEARVNNHVDRDERITIEQGQKIEEVQKLFYSIDARLARIEEKLEIKKSGMGNHRGE